MRETEAKKERLRPQICTALITQYYTVQYYAVQYYAVQYYTVQYYAVQCCTELCSMMSSIILTILLCCSVLNAMY